MAQDKTEYVSKVLAQIKEKSKDKNNFRFNPKPDEVENIKRGDDEDGV